MTHPLEKLTAFLPVSVFEMEVLSITITQSDCLLEEIGVFLSVQTEGLLSNPQLILEGNKSLELFLP